MEGPFNHDAVTDVMRMLLSDVAMDLVERHDQNIDSPFGQLNFLQSTQCVSTEITLQGSGHDTSSNRAGDRGSHGNWMEGHPSLDFMNPKRLQSLCACELCGTQFNSTQALGGHKINSISHKQLLEILREGNLEQILNAVMRLQPTTNAQTEPLDGRSSKRARLSPMAKMPGYTRVVHGFPPTVQEALEKTQSPASFFSSCSLQVFRKHAKFGTLVDSDLAQSGGKPPMAPEEAQEFQVFSRMLNTKKKFLDINRKAVSRRITRIRKGQESTDSEKTKEAPSPPAGGAGADAAGPSQGSDEEEEEAREDGELEAQETGGKAEEPEDGG